MRDTKLQRETKMLEKLEDAAETVVEEVLEEIVVGLMQIVKELLEML